MQTGTDPYRQENKRTVIAVAVGLGLLLLVLLLGGGLASLGLFGGSNAGVTGKQGQGSASLLPLNRDGTNSVLSKSGSIAEPSLPQVSDDPAPALPIPENTPMPADVREWLEHLRKTDARRKKMASSQIGDMLAMMAKMQTAGIADAMKGLFGDEDASSQPEDKVQTFTLNVEKKKSEWKELEQFFLSVRAPSECIPVQASYSQALGETRAMIIEILTAVESAGESPERAIAALTAMQGTSSERIDELAKQTDSQVQQICDKYKTRKWFSVASDVGSGLLGRIGGL